MYYKRGLSALGQSETYVRTSANSAIAVDIAKQTQTRVDSVLCRLISYIGQAPFQTSDPGEHPDMILWSSFIGIFQSSSDDRIESLTDVEQRTPIFHGKAFRIPRAKELSIWRPLPFV